MKTTKASSRIAHLRTALGGRLPARVTQEPFDGDDGHLRRLSRLTRDQRPKPDDLWEYVHDVLYTEIDVPFFVYMLPVCMQAWDDDLRGRSRECGGVIEYFYPVLANRHLFDVILSPRQTAAVSEFMQRSILDEIDEQRGLAYTASGARPYRWIRALTTFGVLLPDIDRLWASWWSLASTGRAVSLVQYVSALMYDKDENPVFAPWTPARGGGPPCLWEYEGHLYEHRWLDANVDYLKRTLTVSAVSDGLSRASARLAGEPEGEMAARLVAEYPQRADLVESRCDELPRILATVQTSSASSEWTV